MGLWEFTKRQTGGLRDSKWSGESAVNRRRLPFQNNRCRTNHGGATWTFRESRQFLGFRLADVTNAAGIQFRHNSGAYGGKLLPETLGAGCAFSITNRWLARHSAGERHGLPDTNASDPLAALPQQPQRHITDVTRSAGLDVEMYGMGVAVGDYNNDGFRTFYHLRGAEPAFRNTGKGTSLMHACERSLSGVRLQYFRAVV